MDRRNADKRIQSALSEERAPNEIRAPFTLSSAVSEREMLVYDGRNVDIKGMDHAVFVCGLSYLFHATNPPLSSSLLCVSYAFESFVYMYICMFYLFMYICIVHLYI